MAFDVYEAVAERFWEMLERGTVLRRHPIQQAGEGWPKNPVSGKGWRGNYVFLLAVTA